MERDYKALFKRLPKVEAPAGLERAILLRIEAMERKAARIKAWLFGTSSVISLGVSVWAVAYAYKNVEESGLFQYVSILFSEQGAALVYWKELSFTVLESLPVLSLIVFLAALGSFVWTSLQTFKNTYTLEIIK